MPLQPNVIANYTTRGFDSLKVGVRLLTFCTPIGPQRRGPSPTRISRWTFNSTAHHVLVIPNSIYCLRHWAKQRVASSLAKCHHNEAGGINLKTRLLRQPLHGFVGARGNGMCQYIAAVICTWKGATGSKQLRRGVAFLMAENEAPTLRFWNMQTTIMLIAGD